MAAGDGVAAPPCAVAEGVPPNPTPSTLNTPAALLGEAVGVWAGEGMGGVEAVGEGVPSPRLEDEAPQDAVSVGVAVGAL